MNLNLETLKQTGAFTGAPVEREITWTQSGEELVGTVFVRPLSYHSAVSDLAALAGQRDAMAGRIASCICDEHGKPIFTPQDITDGPIVTGADGKPELDEQGRPIRSGAALDGNLTMALLTVIAEVSTGGKPQS
ncbi:phage tail assembly chaperone family protein, TAC [Pseudomonas abyssi]|uniref:Phage tail protein n=1 Tax=Pseudomonas abyssi TaxID=170540 RepID=A0A395RAD9_9PSED|nr:phage tail assembly chaperone family protein, TAC [Halopseudomonas gallaeciensis]RGP57076.1 phage tail protein [Halopseudomonas gallaeciensis]